jgi:soluble lytic murein transglycosylase-like protein
MSDQRRPALLLGATVRAKSVARALQVAAPLALVTAVAVHGTLGGMEASREAGITAAASQAMAATLDPIAAQFADWMQPSLPAAPLLAAALSAPEPAPLSPWIGTRTDAVMAAADAAARKTPVQLNKEQANLARFIAQRYRVTLEATNEFVHHAYLAAKDARLDPMLVLAVMSVESSFDPMAQSSAGAQGLMQVLTRVHLEKFMPFGGIRAAFDPVANIRVGSAILREYLQREGTVEGALKVYVGAAFLEHDGGYGAKVLNARDRLVAAAAGKPMPAEIGFVVPRTDRAMIKTVASADLGEPVRFDGSAGLRDPHGADGQASLAVSPSPSSEAQTSALTPTGAPAAQNAGDI